jgi:hypothetical protein
MKFKQSVKCLFIMAIILGAQITILARESRTANPAATTTPEEVVLQWNRVLMETVRTPGAHPSATVFPVRSFAIMHAAMFDAVNSIDGSYTPYLTEVPTTRHSSIKAAAARAARDVLVALYPSRQAIFDLELARSLEGVVENRAGQGVRVGQIVAQRILAARANDGWNAAPPPYVLSTAPGNWQLAPGNTTATFTHYPSVLPFATTSSSQFMPNPPPALTSDEYARDFNEVKEIGSATSQTRTAEQTQIARLWANVNTPTTFFIVWNNVARTIAQARGTSTVENARLFALLNIAHHDALQTAFTSKYQYGLWRPVTAIRRADEDGNANTAQDANWSSLVGAPPYPSYAGNMATIGASQATVFSLFFGRDDVPFQHAWEGAGGATRSYPGFTAMADEEANSRIYGGIHFRFDNVAGQSIGRSVGNYVFLNFMRPRGCDN